MIGGGGLRRNFETIGCLLGPPPPLFHLLHRSLSFARFNLQLVVSGRPGLGEVISRALGTRLRTLTLRSSSFPPRLVFERRPTKFALGQDIRAGRSTLFPKREILPRDESLLRVSLSSKVDGGRTEAKWS